MSKVGIVCDSTCDLGPRWLEEHGVVMVPLRVTIGDTTYLDWIDLEPSAFFDLLKTSPVLPKTSQPSPADFTRAYEGLAAAGCTEIVSVHLSTRLSGTVESASIAASTSPVPVRLVDTLSVNAGVALPIIAAIEARDRGGDADAVEAAARHVAENGRLFFALETMEYLVKGGRVGKAQGVAGSLLKIRPVLTVDPEGVIAAYKKCKGTGKAVAELANTVIDAARARPVKAALLHAQAPDLVEEIRSAIAVAGVPCEIVTVLTVGAVIGTYSGPRAVGVAFYPVP